MCERMSLSTLPNDHSVVLCAQTYSKNFLPCCACITSYVAAVVVPAVLLPSQTVMMAMHGAELEQEVSGLEQALAEQKRLTEEAQASSQAAQQQAEEARTLREQLEQLRSASQAKDTELSSLKVIYHTLRLC